MRLSTRRRAIILSWWRRCRIRRTMSSVTPTACGFLVMSNGCLVASRVIMSSRACNGECGLTCRTADVGRSPADGRWNYLLATADR
jgi:hypothetical protein